MLQISVACFSTIILHSYYLWLDDVHFLFTLLTVFGILYHSNRNTIFQKENPKSFQFIRVFDIVLAHFAFFYMCLIFVREAMYLLVFCFAFLILWYKTNNLNLYKNLFMSTFSKQSAPDVVPSVPEMQPVNQEGDQEDESFNFNNMWNENQKENMWHFMLHAITIITMHLYLLTVRNI